MNSTYNHPPYHSDEVNYNDTTPKVYGWADWWWNNYSSNIDWPSPWCNTILYSQTERGHPTNRGSNFSIFRYGEQPAWSQTVPLPKTDWHMPGFYDITENVG